ncbi:hypothetical protein BASA81_013752 [Batrachochytrium salamandrivorans]|nr:hypothetical protein BASA81_013752 [Batrachochytrium salamandrivorans]
MSLVLSLVLEYLALEVVVCQVRLLSREAQRVVDYFLLGRKRIEFSNFTFPSSDRLALGLARWFNLGLVAELAFDNVRVAGGGEGHDEGFGKRDWRCRVVPFPLGVLCKMPLLVKLRVNSQSSKQEFLQQVGLRRPEGPVLSAPLQLGLGNLHELANGNCPNLELVHCLHVERNRFNEVSDCFGPDCTLDVLRQMRVNCPKLVEIGVLTSPGPRAQQELKRCGRSQHELRETFERSFLSEIAQFQGAMTQVYVSLATHNAPDASSRAVALANRTGNGELFDVAALASTLPLSLHVCVLVRAVAHRVHGKFSNRGMREAAEINALKPYLPANLSLVSTPGDQVTGLVCGHRFALQYSPTRLQVCRSISWSASQAGRLPSPPPLPPPVITSDSMLLDEPQEGDGGEVAFGVVE